MKRLFLYKKSGIKIPNNSDNALGERLRLILSMLRHRHNVEHDLEIYFEVYIRDED